MNIMQELSTNKTNFLLNNKQDFNHTTHGGPQDPIVFIDNISLYFNCLDSVQDVFKWSQNGHIMGGGGVELRLSGQMWLFLHTFYFTTLFQHGGEQVFYRIQNYKYCLPISNPYIIFK